jgi:hypothetical protein
MPARRTRLGRGDRVVVTSPYGSRLGTYDLQTGEVSDVAPTFRATFVAELDDWLVAHDLPRFPGFGEERQHADRGPRRPSRRRLADTLHIPRQGGPRPRDRAHSGAPALEPGPATPSEGWSADSADGFRADAFVDAGRPASEDVAETDFEDLAFHGPDHGLLREAARARAAGQRARDHELRLLADGRHAVADALVREASGPGTGRRAWRMLHGIEMGVGADTVTLDHLVIGTPGVFVVEVRHIPGGKVHASTTGLEIDGKQFDLARIRTVGEEVHDRIAEGIALAAGFEEVLDPPPVTPVIAVVGATIVTHSRPRGVIVARAGDLARAMRSRGERLSPAAVEETFAVARRSDTWLP